MDPAATLLSSNLSELSEEVLQLRGVVEVKEQAIAEKDQALSEKEQRIEQLLDYILLLRKRHFGPASDRPNKAQLNLFDEAELEQLLSDLESAPEESEEEEVEDAPAVNAEDAGNKKKPVRRPLPSHFNRVEKIIDLSDEEKAAMGDAWVFIGYDLSEQLAVIPRQHYVIAYKRAKYVAKDNAEGETGQGVKIAPRPDQIIPKSIAHSSVIADVITRKFVDGLPFYRQEAIHAREGINLSRQTMSSWVIQLHERLSPLMAAIKQSLYQGRVIQIDETRLQVLNEPGRENTRQSYMWVYGGGPPDKPVIWYQYADTRSGDVPVDFLYPEGEDHSDSALYLVTDGYSGYNGLCQKPGIIGHAACWAHVRRKFIDATHGRKNAAAAHQMVALIHKLYEVERIGRGKTAAERQAIREKKSRPILDKIKDWLDQMVGKALPKSPLGGAISYTLGLWPKLNTFLQDGHIEIDNNHTENAIRPFVIGRKNFLFSGSPKGAQASATMYSLVETAKANGLEPWAYLNYLFEKLPMAQSSQELLTLMPHNLKTEDLKL